MNSTIRINDVFDLYAALPWVKIKVNGLAVVDQDNIMSIDELKKDVDIFLEQFGEKIITEVKTKVVFSHHFIIDFILE